MNTVSEQTPRYVASKQLDFLVNEAVWLRAVWRNWQMLANPKLHQREKLNVVAGTFFRVVQDALFNDAVLFLRRAADSERSNGKDNLTLPKVVALFKCVDPEELAHPVNFTALEKERDRFLGFASCLKESRDRVIVHNATAVAIEDQHPPSIQIEKITSALNGFCTCLDLLNESVCGGPLDWDEFDLKGDFVDLLSLIEK